MSRRRQLSDEEQALWTGFARSIKPLRPAKPAAKTAEIFRNTPVDKRTSAIAAAKPSRRAA